MDLSETLYMDIIKMYMWIFDGHIIILTELRIFKLSHFAQVLQLWYVVCVIISTGFDGSLSNHE